MSEERLKKKNGGFNWLTAIKFKKISAYAIGFLIFSFLLYLGGVEALKTAFKPNIYYLIICFIAFASAFLVNSIRWGYISNKIEKRKVCSRFEYFFYFVNSFFLGEYISKVGGDFFLRPGFLNKRHNVPFKRALLAISLEKFLDLLFIFLFLTPAILYVSGIFNNWQAFLSIFVLLSVFCFFFVFRNHIFINICKKFFLNFFTFLKKVPLIQKLVKNSYINKFENLHKFDLLERNSLIALFFLSILRFVFLGIRIYFLSAALGLKIPAFLLFSGIPIAQVGLIIGFTPGALGILEGGWYAVLAAAGIAKEIITAFLIGQRVYWTLFTGLIFLVSYLFFGFINAKKAKACEK